MEVTKTLDSLDGYVAETEKLLIGTMMIEIKQ